MIVRILYPTFGMMQKMPHQSIASQSKLCASWASCCRYHSGWGASPANIGNCYVKKEVKISFKSKRILYKICTCTFLYILTSTLASILLHHLCLLFPLATIITMALSSLMAWYHGVSLIMSAQHP